MTGCEKVLALLADGRWHDHHALYALNVIAHSRVAELRKRGHVIQHERRGDLYCYRLIFSPEAAPAPPLPGQQSSKCSGPGPDATGAVLPEGEPPLPEPGPEQLSLPVAA